MSKNPEKYDHPDPPDFANRKKQGLQEVAIVPSYEIAERHHEVEEFYEKHPEVRELLKIPRPKTRAECIDGPRPCPWVGCRYHLYLEVHKKGAIIVAYPEKHPWELPETCCLDVADQSEHTLDEVGTLLNLTRERVRQIEERGMNKLKKRPILHEIIGNIAFPYSKKF